MEEENLPRDSPNSASSQQQPSQKLVSHCQLQQDKEPRVVAAAATKDDDDDESVVDDHDDLLYHPHHHQVLNMKDDAANSPSSSVEDIEEAAAADQHGALEMKTTGNTTNKASSQALTSTKFRKARKQKRSGELGVSAQDAKKNLSDEEITSMIRKFCKPLFQSAVIIENFAYFVFK